MTHDGCVIAIGALSPLGSGEAAFQGVPAGASARCAISLDPELAAAGLVRPFSARVAPWRSGSSDDRATELLGFALEQVAAALDACRPGWRRERIGVAMGTSSGGMLTAERFFAARASGHATPAVAEGATYFAPLDDALERTGLGATAQRTQILAACAASTVAIGVGLRWLDLGACDLVLAGGYDAVSVFVAAGFEALKATTATRSRPFRVGRDGMSLGEGAGVVALVREDDRRGAVALARIAGFGVSNDAVHITAPDRTGGGLARAAKAALADAGLRSSAVGLVSAHGTATPYNDAMEARALATVFDDAPVPVVHPFKAEIGHTLGAAGVLETLAAADALRTGVAPPAAGEGALDLDAAVPLLATAEARPLHAALKLSAAFGGTNAALVLTASPSARSRRTARPVYLHAFAPVEDADLALLATLSSAPVDRLARLDALCRLGVAAVGMLARAVGREALAGAGLVAGHALATLETNDRFASRLRERGAARVEPRVFPATSPNALVGECAIAFGLTGPAFSVGAGLDGGTEALCRAVELVAAGDAERVVVVAADDAGPVSRDLLALAGWGERELATGAVALLLSSSDDGALRAIAPGLAPDHGRLTVGHLALRRWCEAPPREG